jgi:Xaa-Pro aminopeptidase
MLTLLFLLLQDEPAVSKLEYKARRGNLVQTLKDGLVVLRAQKLAEGEPGIDENTARFDFWYLAGWYREGDILVICGDDAILFTAAPEEARRKAAVEHVKRLDQYEIFLKETLPAAKTVYDWRHPWAREDKLASQKFRDINPNVQVRTNVNDEVTKLRLVKSVDELRCLKKAADATNQAHLAAMKSCKPGMNEGELQKVIEGTFRKNGCPRNAFGSIVGSGKNGVILHYMENKDKMEAGTMVVMDIGAEYEGYAADITRTIPVDGKFTDDHKKAYQAVLDSQRAAEKVCKPGATWADLDAAAAKVLRDRGYARTGYMSFHGLGHYVGLSVHDSGTYAEKLAPGMVITIEPGIYDRKAGYGIRIEDTYVITKDGFERISSGAPREVDEIEKLMGGK